MWIVIVGVCLTSTNPAMPGIMHCAQIRDDVFEVGQIKCEERAPEFIAELDDVYSSMKPVYQYRCEYKGEMV